MVLGKHQSRLKNAMAVSAVIILIATVLIQIIMNER
jgi:hypothetical protein